MVVVAAGGGIYRLVRDVLRQPTVATMNAGAMIQVRYKLQRASFALDVDRSVFNLDQSLPQIPVTLSPLTRSGDNDRFRSLVLDLNLLTDLVELLFAYVDQSRMNY